MPKGWEWCRLGELVSIRGGKRLPKGHSLQDIPTDYIYIRVSDMKNGTVSLDDLRYILPETHKTIEKYVIESNDIYMTIVGATIGKCGLVPEKLSGMNLTENAARLTPFSVIDKYYLYVVLSSEYGQDQFVDKTKQVGVQKMALNRLATTYIPVPPNDMQKKVTNRVDQLMALCDQLKAKLADSKTTQLNLTDALVAQAV
ncbi:restriction endonuclease subunit S [Marinomonas sp. IMCC 4694]|uniref:restriction endonuclease subunit S n=1 Tax=Marinomonas sp. IMCC 4694 TaxID=2605432 RepID=UPI001CA35E1E|nr:restriction endonuclease subunit S [Marinomonas sp. IMCC 4694]